jgi:hypothetical protein
MATAEPAPHVPVTVASSRAGWSRRGVDATIVGGLAVVLLALFSLPGILNHHVVPVGPDVPVYLWWARVAASEGVSAVGDRPGAPVLIPAIGGALDIGIVDALSGIQYALGPAIGLASAALVRGRGSSPRPAWIVAGLFAGVWATYLGEGYVANLAFVAAYLAGAAMLARRTRRGVIAAAVLFGGGGLAHPQFFAVGAGILLFAALWSAWRDRTWSWRSDAGRTLASLLGGGAIVTAGIAASLSGPPRIDGDTSKDAFLRRTGRFAELRRVYLDRFTSNWRRYAPIMSTVLVVMGALQGRGYARRFLVSWLALSAVALPVGLLTTWYPPDRILTFAFCIPLLAALGFVWLGRRLGRWWIAWPVGVAVGILMVLPPMRSWADSPTFVSPLEIDQAVEAGRIAATTPPRTPLVFVANDPRTRSLFLASHVLNVARAAVPPSRADDVWVFVGSVGDLLEGRPTDRHDQLYDLASATSLGDIPDDPPMVVFVLSEFDRDPDELRDPRLTRWGDGLTSTTASPADPDALVPDDGEPAASDPESILAATIATFLLLVLVGAGWGWWATERLPGTLLIAPAFGVAALTIVSLGLERLGAGIASRPGGVTAALVAGGGGYALALLRERQRREQRRR